MPKCHGVKLGGLESIGKFEYLFKKYYDFIEKPLRTPY